jgi:hypothetical protein
MGTDLLEKKAGRRAAEERIEAERPRIEFGGAWEYSPAPESTDIVRLEKRYGLFIGGRFVPARSGKTFQTITASTSIASRGSCRRDRASWRCSRP